MGLMQMQGARRAKAHDAIACSLTAFKCQHFTIISLSFTLMQSNFWTLRFSMRQDFFAEFCSTYTVQIHVVHIQGRAACIVCSLGHE